MKLYEPSKKYLFFFPCDDKTMRYPINHEDTLIPNSLREQEKIPIIELFSHMSV